MITRKILPLLALATLAACGPDTAEITSLTGDVNRGIPLYNTNCKGCHGESGNEMAPAAREAKEEIDEAASVILKGDGTMPSFEGKLSNQEIADILAYLRTK